VKNIYTEGGICFKNIRAIFTEFYYGQYSPLNELMYLFLYTLFGYNPLVFHLSSLLIHAVNACLVFLCLRIFLERYILGKGNNNIMIAFMTAMFFAVHPLNVESVAWISASKIILCSFFYLLATLGFLSYLKKGKLIYYFLTILLFTCSFLSKEQAVIFPVWLALILWIGKIKSRKTWAMLIPVFVLAILFGIITMRAGSSEYSAYPVGQRIVFFCYSLTEYFIKFIFPNRLSYVYPFPFDSGGKIPILFMVYSSLIIILFVSLWKYIKSNKIIAFGLLYIIIHLSLTLHIIPLPRFVIIADRYGYLPLIGMGFMISYFIVNFMKNRNKRIKTLIISGFFTYLLCLGVYAHIRTHVWNNTDELKKEIREEIKKRKGEIKEKQTINIIK
jgi:hypothetical protein